MNHNQLDGACGQGGISSSQVRQVAHTRRATFRARHRVSDFDDDQTQIPLQLKDVGGKKSIFFFSFKLQSRFFLRASKVNNTDAKNSLPEHKRRPIILSYEEEAIHHNCTKLLKISLKLQSFDVAQNTRETAIDAKNRICVTH